MCIHSSSMLSHRRALDHDFCREGGAIECALIKAALGFFPDASISEGHGAPT